MSIVHIPAFTVISGTSVHALADLSQLAGTGTTDAGMTAALGQIGDPTGETWRHLFGLCLDLEEPRSLAHLVDHIDTMDATRFRLVLLGHTAWSWRSIVGADTIEQAAHGDLHAQAKLLADDRYYAGVAAAALPTVLGLDAHAIKRRFIGALEAYSASSDVERLSGDLAAAASRVEALARSEGWTEAIELLCGYGYVPEPEARRVVVLPHLAGPGLLLAQHDDARLIVHGETYRPGTHEHIATLGKALADESRVHLLAVLAGRPHQLGELVETTGLTRSTVHHHLRQLRAAGLVTVEGNARAYRYAISARGRSDAITALGDLLGITQKGRPTA
jgi:DNA-binding transcriptional ArsR family regulator